jgi:prophage tail gpP-like protein
MYRPEEILISEQDKADLGQKKIDKKIKKLMQSAEKQLS